jgi:hypothetical protein
LPGSNTCQEKAHDSRKNAHANTPGRQQARFTFLAGADAGRFQADDFWVDSRASGQVDEQLLRSVP